VRKATAGTFCAGPASVTIEVWEPSGAQANAMPSPDSYETGESILVVDDDPDVLRIMADILSQAGYRVLPAGGGWSAIETFETAPSPPRLLVTDVIMPDLTGPVLAARLRKLRPELKVLFVSGFHDTELVQRFVGQQGFALLPKPFTPDGLLRTVREALAKNPV
jgi:two-component system cell cycle sensor histidine kinase/response regulator CckA